MELSFELLKTFVTVVETMNFTHAAERLYKTQSAVSLQMKRLAEEAGRPLFSQTGKKLSLTEAGERLHSYAVRLIRLHDEACAAISAQDMEGCVTLGASEDYSTTILPPILADFAKKYPNVKVNLHCGTSADLKKMLDGGDMDIAILAEHEEEGRLLQYDPIVWLASRSYVYDGGEVPLAVYPDYCVARNSATKKLREAGVSYRIAYESQSGLLIKAAVQSGMAVAPALGRGISGDFRVFGPAEGFPELPMIPITLHRKKGRKDEITDTLEDYIIKAFREEQRGRI